MRSRSISKFLIAVYIFVVGIPVCLHRAVTRHIQAIVDKITNTGSIVYHLAELNKLKGLM